MNNHSTESHFTIYHSASVSSRLSLTMKKKKVFQRRKIQITKQVSITIKKLGYSKYKTDINSSEENKLFKVQKRCLLLSLQKWNCSFYTPRTKKFKYSLPRIPCWLLTFPNSFNNFNLWIGWINTRWHTDLDVYRSTFTWWFLYRTITLRITPSLLGTISLIMSY